MSFSDDFGFAQFFAALLLIATTHQVSAVFLKGDLDRSQNIVFTRICKVFIGTFDDIVALLSRGGL
jgi:hypothetical protein